MSGHWWFESYLCELLADHVQAATDIPIGALVGRESTQHIRSRITVTANSDAKPMKVGVASKGRDDASRAVVTVGRAAKLDGEVLGFVLERVVDDDHRTREFGGVTQCSGNRRPGDVHERLWCVGSSQSDDRWKRETYLV